MITKTKRLMASRVVNIPRKTFFWSPSARAGRHNKESAVPLLTILRDYLHIGDKEREITRILANGLVKVDGKIVKDRRFPVGFMDVVSIDQIDKSYRVVYDTRGRLVIADESKENSERKLMKVLDKKTIKGGKTQLTLHDGQGILTEDKSIKPGDVLIVKLPEKSVEHVLKLQPGNKAFLVGGSHVGKTVTVKKIEIKKSSYANLVHFEEDFSTISDYVFVVGGPKYSFEVPKVGEGVAN